MIRGVPYDAEVEYIQSTGTQWIDTGLKSYNSSTAASLKHVRFSGRLAPMSLSGSLYHGWNGWGFWGGLNGKWKGTSVQYDVGRFYDVEQVYTPSTSTCGMWVDGTRVFTDSWHGNANTYGVGLFCIGNYNGTVNGAYSGGSLWRMGHMYVESMGEVRNFIPVRVGTAGALYDRAHPHGGPNGNGLYFSRGRSSFVVGPDVATPVMGLHFMRGAMTAKDYIQDGLIAMWDGIENAGWGVHNSNAAVWKELVNGWDLPMPSGTIWNEDSVGPLNPHKNGYFGKASKQEMSVAMAANNAAAFEISFLKTGDTISPEWHTAVGQGPNFYLRFLNNQVAMYNNGGMTGSGHYFYNFRLSKNVFHTLVLNMESGKKCQVYADGVRIDESRNVGDFGIHLWKTGNYQQKWSFCAEKQYCCRIYNRVLTSAEIAANHAIDVERFGIP